MGGRRWIGLLAASLLAGCARAPAPAPAAELPPVRVNVAVVRMENVPVITEVTGTVRPVQRAALAAKVMGAIEEIPAMLGQRVRTGDLLVKISAGEISARLAQAQSQLHAVQRDLGRERELLTKGASAVETVRSLEDRLVFAQAMVREAEVMLGYTIVRAPFDGVVARRLAHAGDLASPGTPLVEVEGTLRFEVEADLPESVADTLARGQWLGVEVPSSGAEFEAAIAEVSSAADPRARTVSVKLDVPREAPVRSGQFVRVRVPGAPGRALFAPAGAVSTFGQLERVFTVADDGRARLRLVKTGARQGERVEIVAGLGDGERVVVQPPATLSDGQRLEIAP